MPKISNKPNAPKMPNLLNLSPPRVCIVGMGFVGLTLAVFMAEKDFIVEGVETNPKVLEKLRGSNPHFFENGLSDIFKKVSANGKLTIDSKINSRSEVESKTFIITVGTPILNNEVNIGPFQAAVESIKPHLREGDTIISRSTMGIGMTRSLLLDPIKNYIDCNVVSCPERTIEGNALNELASLPQIIGGDEESKREVENLFKLLGIETIDGGSLEEVEFIKLMTNTYRDSQFALANEFAMFAERLNLQFDKLVEVSKYRYERMKDLRRQGPSSGPCLSKDPIIMNSSSLRLTGIDLELVNVARKTNKKLAGFAINQIGTLSESFKTFGILGLSFKGQPETDDTRDSFSIELVNYLLSQERTEKVIGFDPLNATINVDNERYVHDSNIEFVLNNSECVFITNNHPYFKSFDFYLALRATAKTQKGIIYDFWKNLDVHQFHGWKLMNFGGSQQ